VVAAIRRGTEPGGDPPALDWRSEMHAVVVRVSIGDAEIADKGLRESVVPAVSSAPGFVSAYWTRSDDRSNGLSMLVFESEDAARAVAERFRGGTIIPETVTVSRIEVREVVANA
jgi:hypothetical protein